MNPWDMDWKDGDSKKPWEMNYSSSPNKPAMEHTQYQRVKPVQQTGGPMDFFAGIRSGGSDIYRAIQQRKAEAESLFGRQTDAEKSRLYEEEEASRERRNYDPSVTAAEKVGRGATMFGATLPFAMVPGGQGAIGSTIASGVLGGLSGAMFPTTSGTETLANIGAGSGGQAVGNLIGRAIMPTTARNMTQARKDINDIATAEGIPLRTSEATGSRYIKNWETVRSNRPYTGSMEERFNNAQTEAINRAISRKLGREVKEIGQDELKRFSDEIGGTVRNMVKGRNVPLDTDFFNAIVDVDTAAGVGGKLTYLPEIRKAVDNSLDFITSKGSNPSIKGEEAQAIRSLLQDRARDARSSDAAGGTELASALEKIVGGLKKAMTGTMSDSEKKAWYEANRMYANYKLVEESFIRDPKSVAAGDMPLNKLARVMEQTRPRSYVHGTGDYAGLAKLGQAIRPPSQNALLSEGSIPLVRKVEDIGNAAVYPFIESRLMQEYLTGAFPGQRMVRDMPMGAESMDAMLRLFGIDMLSEDSRYK